MEKLLGICVHYEEEPEAEVTNATVQNNKCVCENSQMEDDKTTNDVAEFTNGSAENHKPIPDIETDIENTCIDSREGSDTTAIIKPVSLTFISDVRFRQLYELV